MLHIPMTFMLKREVVNMITIIERNYLRQSTNGTVQYYEGIFKVDGFKPSTTEILNAIDRGNFGGKVYYECLDEKKHLYAYNADIYVD